MEYLPKDPVLSPTDAGALVKTFNQSAGDFDGKRLTAGLLSQKYEALLNYKAKDDETKAQLADAMFNALEKALRSVASPRGRIQANDYVSEIKPLLDTLTKPESAPYIPARAPETMADIAVALADRVGKVTPADLKEFSVYEGHMQTYRDNATSLGSLVMQYAKTFASLIDEKAKPAKLSVPNNKLQA